MEDYNEKKMKNLIKPNWKKSNLNISATLAEFLGAENHNATLPIIKEELKKGYKNVLMEWVLTL